MRKERRNLELKGIREVSPSEFTVFATKIFKNSDNCCNRSTNIPAQICKYLGLDHKDYVEIAIRNISKKELKEVYGINV